MGKIVALSILVVLLSITNAGSATIIYVDADANGVNDGSSWTNAYNFLQDALTVSSSGDEIWVAQGIYRPDESSADPNGSGDPEATFQLINGVAIRGGYAGFGEPDPNARDIELYETILSGDLNGDDGANFANNGENSYHVVTGSGTDETAALDGFTIIAGNANGPWQQRYNRGGGMYNYGGSPTVTNCVFIGNAASDGGGIYNSSSSPTLNNCIFSGNLVGYSGSGMYNRDSSNPTLTKCIFTGNSGLSYHDSFGSGMYNYQSNPALINCTFSGNSGSLGGGMYNYHSSPTLTNCTFSGNSVHEGGGGMRNCYSSPTLTNCTFSGNWSDWYGEGGIKNDEDSKAALTNCILWADTPGEISGTPVVTYSNVEGGWVGVGNIDADPCFADAANGDYHLKSQAGRWEPNVKDWVTDANTSPCIDAGNPSSPIGFEPFPNGGRINMGAYGGTVEASKSYFGLPVCQTIVAGDINGDCKVNFTDFALIATHWLEDKNPALLTSTYVFQPDPNALSTSGGFAGQGRGTYSVEGQFELTVDFNAGIASFNRVDATISEEIWFYDDSTGDDILTDSLDVLFHMTELVSTNVNDTAIDFVLLRNNPTFPAADVHLRVTFLDGSVQLVGDFCEAVYDGYCYHLNALAVPEP